MPKRRKRKKHWSYNAGERGRNWVRAYRQPRDGRFYLEWREDGRRRALRLQVDTEEQAAAKADELAARFAEIEPEQEPEKDPPITLAELLARYLKEVTPGKGHSKQGHDRRALRVWTAFFAAQEEVARQITRLPSSLDRIDWDRFIRQRRAGEIPGWDRPVRDRQVGYDLGFLVAALNWAVGARVIASNPWSSEIRRVQRWEQPGEKNPRRPSMPDDVREGLIAHAPSWQFGAALVLEKETRRRNNAIRQLLWSDIDQERWQVRWRAELDKAGRENVTPLTPRAIEVLKALPSRAIGPVPVFPSARDPARPTPSETFQTWLGRAKRRWLEQVAEDERAGLARRLFRVGFHAEKRTGVRDPWFRSLPPAIQEEIAGTQWGTLRRVYDEVTVEDMREAMKRAPERAGSGSNYEHQLRAGEEEAGG